MVPAAGRDRVPGYNRPVTGPVLELQREDLELEVGGARVAARRLRPGAAAAAAPTLVLLHEGLGCVDAWRAFPERLVRATGLPALLYDRRGYGRSSALDRPWGVDYLHRAALEELPAVLAACAVERPLLVGHSDGGTIALLAAAHHAPVAVVTEAAHAFVEEAARTGIRRTERRWASGELKRGLERLHGPKAEAIFRSWADTWLAPWFDGWSITGELPAVTCPALLLQGADDEYATPGHLAEIAARLGGPVRAELLPGCGHAPHHEAPTVVIDLVVDWLSSWMPSLSAPALRCGARGGG
jgi:pimeloyl-ACP methyl ester carboxylesterase